MQHLLDPKNDFVFKRQFAESPDLLADLINAVRSEEPPVEIIEVLNPRIDPAELQGKFIVLDVLAKDEFGRLYNIEMQVRRHVAYLSRSAYYLANTLAGQLKTGEDYSAIKPVIGIHLLGFDLFEQNQAHWCFELRDRHFPAVTVENTMQLHMLELPKADRLRKTNAEQTGLAAWVAYFEHWQEETVMESITHGPVRQAMRRLEALSADDEAKRLAFVRERALHDEVTELKAARDEGEVIGLAKGVALVLTSHLGPLPEEICQRLAQADTAQLERWASRVIGAATLAEVFEVCSAG